MSDKLTSTYVLLLGNGGNKGQVARVSTNEMTFKHSDFQALNVKLASEKEHPFMGFMLRMYVFTRIHFLNARVVYFRYGGNSNIKCLLLGNARI